MGNRQVLIDVAKLLGRGVPVRTIGSSALPFEEKISLDNVSYRYAEGQHTGAERR